ncbi:MAG: ABC transporter ATP-binding protein/permease [Clostridia bacterium]|nr:ABC transporter ATP-binding protein/permease [Clostridia bacterium]
MLQLKNIVKTYVTGDVRQDALQGVSLSFRDSEFVSVLGQSGSGKTTLLNLIGGLDRYTSGDLIINGVSTKRYRDADWDAYRNHTIGFVFQSYNLIPHQSVLANVELALTLAGVSKKERRARALAVLDKVGLREHVHKRPNQMSGGQMQRVAIARALINDPDILLADEPTGALDSQTSVQILDLLKEIARDKLVIMVTHNPELAQQYSTRIVHLLDGRVVSDTDPFEPPAPAEPAAQAAVPAAPFPRRQPGKKRVSMSFVTALSLSFHNLRTKKGRTLLTSFAGSIGIIGIALILSLSTGIKDYVNAIQRDTLSSYPISIEQKESPLAALLNASAEMREQGKDPHGSDAVYANNRLYKLFNVMFAAAESQTNNLTAFKAMLDAGMADENSELRSHVSTIQYGYDLRMNVYVPGADGKWQNTDFNSLLTVGSQQLASSPWTNMMGSSGNSSFELWSELLPGPDGEPVSDLLYDQYDLLAGEWPQAAGDILLVLDKHNEITDVAFYALGLMQAQEVQDIFNAVMTGSEIVSEERSISYEQALQTTFRLVVPADLYSRTETGVWASVEEDEASLALLIDNGLPLRICGVVRPNPDAAASSITGTFAYTTALTQYVIQKTEQSPVVIEQRKAENSNYDVFTGLPFVLSAADTPDDAEKAARITEYFASLSPIQKSEMYVKLLAVPPAGEVEAVLDGIMQQFPGREQTVAAIAAALNLDQQAAAQYLSAYSDAQLTEMLRTQLEKLLLARYEEQARAAMLQIKSSATAQGDVFGVVGYAAVAAAFDALTGSVTDPAVLVDWYDRFMPAAVSDSTLADNLALLSAVDERTPQSIRIYAKTFEDKAALDDMITAYNEGKEEEDRITYTDYVALLMSGVTTMIDAVSYGLIAFVSISLVVSSIMIGIITYISVLERTKEIGILRSVGASRRDISRVFNAETAIVGFVAGWLGILITLLINVPIGLIIENLTNIGGLTRLPWQGALVLVGISIVLTLIAGLIPARMAAKKDPVIALRTE